MGLIKDNRGHDHGCEFHDSILESFVCQFSNSQFSR
jgi:hypothetical protein